MKELQKHANNIRKNIIRMVYQAKSGHPGGSLSAADILTVLYFKEMDINQENLHSIDRDRFVLSKGHASPALYGVLSEMGFIPEEELLTFRKSIQNYKDILVWIWFLESICRLDL